jgi:hypothetical protein
MELVSLASSLVVKFTNLPHYETDAGIAQWYSAGLWAGRLRGRVPAGAGTFSLHHRVQNGSGDHPTSYSLNRGSFPGGKAAAT